MGKEVIENRVEAGRTIDKALIVLSIFTMVKWYLTVAGTGRSEIFQLGTSTVLLLRTYWSSSFRKRKLMWSKLQEWLRTSAAAGVACDEPPRTGHGTHTDGRCLGGS